MIRFIIVCLTPFTETPNKKIYFFLGFRNDDFMNKWLKNHNINWYQKTEWTIYGWIRHSIINLLNNHV